MATGQDEEHREPAVGGTSDGSSLRILNVLAEHTRQALVSHAAAIGLRRDHGRRRRALPELAGGRRRARSGHTAGTNTQNLAGFLRHGPTRKPLICKEKRTDPASVGTLRHGSFGTRNA